MIELGAHGLKKESLEHVKSNHAKFILIPLPVTKHSRILIWSYQGNGTESVVSSTSQSSLMTTKSLNNVRMSLYA